MEFHIPGTEIVAAEETMDSVLLGSAFNGLTAKRLLNTLTDVAIVCDLSKGGKDPNCAVAAIQK